MFSLASKHNDPNASLAWSERIGYGTGGFAFNMINGIIGSFLTIYFTSTVGLNAGIIATIFAISKVFDGISDTEQRKQELIPLVLEMPVFLQHRRSVSDLEQLYLAGFSTEQAMTDLWMHRVSHSRKVFPQQLTSCTTGCHLSW